MDYLGKVVNKIIVWCEQNMLVTYIHIIMH